MRILIAHNAYCEPGGEERVVAAETALLAAAGHEVVRYDVHNDDVSRLSAAEQLVTTIWSRESRGALSALITRHRPDVVHFHNTFPLISPAAYSAVGAHGIPVVQTLHNWRMLCAGATFYRDGAACFRCLHASVPWRGIVHGCYRGSRTASAATVAALAFHRARGTWTRDVDAFIAISAPARERFVRGGLPAARVHVKRHFVHTDPGCGHGRGGFALVAGRLSTEKGILTVLRAWERLGARLPLKIVGGGPLASIVEMAARAGLGVEWLGERPHHEVLALMRDAFVLISASECLESFGLTTIEAFAAGVPVVRSVLAAEQQADEMLVDDGRTGLHFPAGDADALVRQVERLLANPREHEAMRLAARLEYEAHYSAAPQHRALLDIYDAARRARAEPRGATR